jgi:hypothetical protein
MLTGVGAPTRRPLTYVPLVDPRSLKTKPSGVSFSSQWRPEAKGESTIISQSARLPITQDRMHSFRKVGDAPFLAQVTATVALRREYAWVNRAVGVSARIGRNPSLDRPDRNTLFRRFDQPRTIAPKTSSSETVAKVLA